MNQLTVKARQLLKNESGQTILEYTVFCIMLAIGIVVIGLAIQNGVVDIIKAIVGKILALINSMSI